MKTKNLLRISGLVLGAASVLLVRTILPQDAIDSRVRMEEMLSTSTWILLHVASFFVAIAVIWFIKTKFSGASGYYRLRPRYTHRALKMMFRFVRPILSIVLFSIYVQIGTGIAFIVAYFVGYLPILHYGISGLCGGMGLAIGFEFFGKAKPT